MPSEATGFIADMIADVQEGFQPDATTNFEATALHGLTDISATSGRVVCMLPVTQRVQNRYNTLHGGCTGKFGFSAYSKFAKTAWQHSNAVHHHLQEVCRVQ